MPHSSFANRSEAGCALAERLRALGLERPVVLALPRGGVPVALEIARALGAPLELVLVRKIGVPGQRELAAAAVVDGSEAEIVLNRSVMRAAGLTEADIREAARSELLEIERRRSLYLGGRRRESLAGRPLVVVDDGIATGASIKAAIAALKRRQPPRLVVAVPVAARDVIEEIEAEGAEVVCLTVPEPFYAVGMHYRDFHQLSDREVVEALAEADRLLRPARSPAQ